MFYRTNSQQISDFLYGHNIAEAIKNAFCYRLNYRIKPTGVENSFGPVNKYLRNAARTSQNQETLINIESMRKEPDAILISPNANINNLEIKSKKIGSLEDFLRNPNNKKEIERVLYHYPAARFLYVDVEKKKLASISGLLPLIENCQYENWNAPWTWIEGIPNEEAYEKWINEYIFDPLALAANKIVSRSSTKTKTKIEIDF
tara:strand:- start:270 stop:878 length:609 start_codon:yes stop_codon:yes gene_type:complete